MQHRQDYTFLFLFSFLFFVWTKSQWTKKNCSKFFLPSIFFTLILCWIRFIIRSYAFHLHLPSPSNVAHTWFNVRRIFFSLFFVSIMHVQFIHDIEKTQQKIICKPAGSGEWSIKKGYMLFFNVITRYSHRNHFDFVWIFFNLLDGEDKWIRRLCRQLTAVIFSKVHFF